LRDPKFWQALLSLNLGSRRYRELVDSLGEGATLEDLLRHPGLSDQQRSAVAAVPESFTLPDGVRILELGDPEYPENLRLASDPPPALFVRGGLMPRDDIAVAIVGTRKASPYGKALAARIARELAAAGVTIVSGAAYGIDAAAHRGALEAGGRTIAVLGSGVDRPYPLAHASLLEEIARSGAVVSQFPMGTPPDAYRFPSRNYVIAALVRAVVVVEAPIRSGALLTATLASDEGRHVFVAPAPMDSESHYGGFELVNEGAHLLYDVGQVLLSLGTDPAISAERNNTPDLSALQRRIIERIGDKPALLDHLSDELNCPSSAVLAELTQLEIAGLVARVGGGYVRI
jgi:DNA processing protein